MPASRFRFFFPSPISRYSSQSFSSWAAVIGLLVFSVLTAGQVVADTPPPSLSVKSPETAPRAFAKDGPESVADLIEMEKQFRKISKEVIPTTVNLQIGNAQGSGVIVSDKGEILTAAHVIGGTGREVRIILADGRRVKGETLGLNRDLDIGLVRITEKGKWPVAEMADMKKVETGDWCLATGHPGGYRKNRPPVVRVGRVILMRDDVIQTDCTLVGGDSGGPVFNMEGKVIGINSRIGASTAWNFHVPVSAYQDNWERLVKAETWTNRPGPMAGGPILGVSGNDHPKGCQLTAIGEELPADKAGLREGDIITALDGKPVTGFESLAALVRTHKPGDRVKVEFLRGDQTLTKDIELAERS